MERVAVERPQASKAIAAKRNFWSKLPFRAVNVPGSAGYRAGMQRHHLLPRQVLSNRGLRSFLDAVGPDRLGFDDFRRNGMLLPATDTCAVQLGLPLHRGPHRAYSELVAERAAQIEAGWSKTRLRDDEQVGYQAIMRLDLLQRALRRRLLDVRRRPLLLNVMDPWGNVAGFSELDAMVDALWSTTGRATTGD